MANKPTTLEQLVRDAVTLTGAKRITDEGTTALWRLPGRSGQWTTNMLVSEAINMAGKAGWE